MSFVRFGLAVVLPLACAALEPQSVTAQSLDAGASARAAAVAGRAAAVAGRAAAIAARAEKASPRAPLRVETLLAKMTLEEKAGQLTQWGAQQTPTGPRVRAGSEEDIKAGRVGSFLGAFGVEQTRRLQRVAVEESRLHVPLLFSFDVIHGFRTQFPVPLAEAASFDPGLAERCARAAAVEATAHGVHWTYAPMVDVARDARWGRVVEGAGEDPFLGASFAVARVRGLRGNPGDATSLMATVKHFVGYGAAEAGREYNTVDLSERSLRETYLPPFRAAIEAGADAVMPAFNELAGMPMHANRALLRDVLRTEWGFRGLVVSDYTGIMELTLHGIAANAAEASQVALEATVDVDMIADFYSAALPELVRRGKVPQKLLDDAVRRVLTAKERVGLFADPYRHMDPAIEKENELSPGSRALAREAGQKSIVLLKNERGLLPLKRDELKTLAVIGTLAVDGQSALGNWAAAGEPRDAVTVLDGIRSAISPNTKLLYARGAFPTGNDLSGLDEAVRVAGAADAVIWVAGESEAMSGEAHSRGSIGLPGVQDALFERLLATGKPMVVVLMNGRPLAIPRLAEGAQAILETWFLGSEMGNSVADVIFGRVNPSGKLPMTFPRAVGQVPIYYNHKRTGRPPRVEELYTSKYLDIPWTPIYPFGYGLSYTSFGYEPPRLSATKLKPRDTLTVQVTVKNTGSVAGDEVVQLYLRDDVASFTRPVRALRGFTRVTLEPGAARDLTFTLDQEDFALLDDKLRRVVEPGTFTVFVGGSSETDNKATFEITAGARLPGHVSAVPRTMRAPPAR
ncbi:MAG: beta-glucosidase [Myxococcaceae bacterium]|nr:beta-glucosidase [Myxococcaceae bacterium]